MDYQTTDKVEMVRQVVVQVDIVTEIQVEVVQEHKDIMVVVRVDNIIQEEVEVLVVLVHRELRERTEDLENTLTY